MEGDPGISFILFTILSFQSTPSAWRETIQAARIRKSLPFQSTPSAWRETCRNISRRNESRISIHSLRMEGDTHRRGWNSHGSRFQSTPSAWRETENEISYSCESGDFNPLPPHGGRQFLISTVPDGEIISIHSLRMEGDDGSTWLQLESGEFQSTPSAWRETSLTFLLDDFALFQSTPSAWRETTKPIDPNDYTNISIHSLRMEGDLYPRSVQLLLVYFNPLPPHGGRLRFENSVFTVHTISIHSLRMEGDWIIPLDRLEQRKFQSTPSAWRETHGHHQLHLGITAFQSTPSAWRETL